MMIRTNEMLEALVSYKETAALWLTDSLTYYELSVVAIVFCLVYGLGKLLRMKLDFLSEPNGGIKRSSNLWFLRRSGRLLYPLIAALLLSAAISFSENAFGQSEIIQAVQRAVLVWFLWVGLKAFVTNPFVRTIALWILIPAALLQLLGWFELVVNRLSAYGVVIGEVEITAYTVVKAVFYVSFLLWVGRMASRGGEQYIRDRKNISRSTKELLIKLFDICLYAILFLVTLNLIGIDLTALAVFGGALGVGLGFGLQKIASNFISGLILLTEKSINIGNLIEMNDGIFGYVRKLGARASVVETFDGKEVMVPNEDFITSRVSNLTYSNSYGRVDIPVGVDYGTDLDLAHKLILEAAQECDDVVTDNPNYRSECFLREFGDNSVNFLLVFWLDDVTKGRWKAQSDVMFAIWHKFKAHHISIPFPQRDIHIRSGLERFIKSES